MKNRVGLLNKIYRKWHWFLFAKLQPGDWILYFYPVFWHGKKYARKHGKKITEMVNDVNYASDVYVTQIPNIGAGIGHQISNHNSGIHCSRMFNCKFAYSSFADKEWDEFLGFGNGETSVTELLNNGYKLLRIPFYDNGDRYPIIKNIIDSYSGKKVVLQTELDQFYKNQYEIIPYIKNKFENAKESRLTKHQEDLIFDKEETNIAVHIRRGDITAGQSTGEQTLTKRWLDRDYYKKVLDYIVNNIKPEKPLHIYIFSQGNEDYSDFEKYGKVTSCLDMPAMESFIHMVRADILVTSKSSFSYKPALLADGIRICPDGFWHGYPEDSKWIVMKL